jgi:hypothetical protein
LTLIIDLTIIRASTLKKKNPVFTADKGDFAQSPPKIKEKLEVMSPQRLILA